MGKLEYWDHRPESCKVCRLMSEPFNNCPDASDCINTANCRRLEDNKIAGAPSKHSHLDLKALGYTIDNTCYPNIAYKGARFSPVEWFDVLTEKEHDLLSAAKEVVKVVTSDKLRGKVRDNFSEQVSLSQLSKAVHVIENR